MSTRRPQTRGDRDAQPEQPASNGAAEGQELDQESLDNLRNQLSDALRPAISNLQQQISQAVQQQVRRSSRESSQAESGEETEATGLERFGRIGEIIQIVVDKIVELFNRFLAWLNEKVEELGEYVAEAVGALAGKIVQQAVRSAF